MLSKKKIKKKKKKKSYTKYSGKYNAVIIPFIL